ncbi:hypothetical protein [Ensifer soli]|uniref:hypothetical protein n=1 Tax=Ciceribacter sp. sgz301302 TaxID=3342379 RepID=UPI0035BB2A58
MVEALATMTISAFLLVALASVVALVMRASYRSARLSETVEQSSRIVDALARDIGAAAPIRWAGGGFVFTGSQTALTFARTLRQPDGASTIQLVSLAGKGNMTIETASGLPPDARGPTDITAEGQGIVFQQGRTIRFAYFSRLEDGREALTDTWTSPDAMPVAVRATVRDATGATLGTVRIPFRIDAEPGCAAPERGHCGLAPRVADDPGTEPVDQGPIDPDDALGWLRYGQQP